MKLRVKIFLFAVVPFMLAMFATTMAVYSQSVKLAQQQKQIITDAWLASKETELHHYLNLARSAIEPLLDQKDSLQARQHALSLLAQLEYGHDGYFFVYDLQGTSLMHPRQPELVGQNLWEWRDPSGTAVIQELLAAARQAGRQGQAVQYSWIKPSTQHVVDKLGYVTILEKWGWILGTGIYQDEIEAALTNIDTAASTNIRNIFAWVAGIAVVCIAAVALCGLALNVSDHRKSDATLRLMAQHVVRSQEEERAHLSRELHDGISQLLISIKLLLEAARERLHQLSPINRQALEITDKPLSSALARLNTVVSEVRRISHKLRPALLEDLGLPAALEHLCREISTQQDGGVHTLSVNFQQEGADIALPEHYATALFRIAQEALTNALRHANASSITVALHYACESVALIIQDDGAGFDVDAVQLDPQRGIGLRNMTERLEFLGGHLNIHSSEQGTRLCARLPLP